MWQRFIETHRDQPFQLLGVAVDARGASAARPYVEKSGITYPTLIDSQNLLADLFGLKSVPFLLMIDENGVYRGRSRGEEGVEEWLSQPPASMDEAPHTEPSTEDWRALAGANPEDASIQMRFGESLMREGHYAEAEPVFESAARLMPGSPASLFRLGAALAAQGRKTEATAAWRLALEHDPGNWLIRKQIWAVEHPERFYAGDVDYDWQKAQG